MSIKIASMNFGDCDTILHNTPNGMKNIAEVLGPNGEVYWSSIKELTGIPPLSIRSNGTILLDYLISGNMSQTGTPTPTTPIQPSECGERTTNLCPMIFSHKGVVDDNGGVSIQNTRLWTEMIPVSASSSYYVAINGKASNDEVLRFNRAIQYDASGTFISRINTGANITATFTTDANCAYIVLDIRTISLNVNLNNTDVNTIQMNAGSTALPYEPYGVKIPISSAGTTTPVYLGEVETTRRIEKIDLGTLNWTKTASGNFWSDNFISDMKTIHNTDTGNAICTTFKEVTPNAVASTPYSFSSCLNGQQRPFVNKTGFENLTVEEFKQAMSGVYMYYVLANEETGIVNEPLRKIGDYADTISMEQAGVQIPTNNGNTVIDVDTTLKPSQMYIKYK